MSLRSHDVLIVLSLATALSWSPEALPYSRSSSISYTVSTQTLSGYSRTWKDIWDPDYYYDCTSWVWDDIYGYYCYVYQLQIDYAHVYSDLNSPSGFYETTQHTHLYDATATHAVTVTTQSGTWTVTGRHYVVADIYVYVCPYGFCFPPAYVGTTSSSVGSNTTAQHAVIPMTISRYSTSSLTDTDASSILASASALLQANDGGGDVACPLTFQRSGSVGTFSVGDGSIDNQSEQDAVQALGTRVKVVNSFTWCNGPPTIPGATINGCGKIGGFGIIVRRDSASIEPTLWAHEYGHNQGKLHNPTTGFVMYESPSNYRRVTQSECYAMTHPLN
jgi:hypothetical protein